MSKRTTFPAPLPTVSRVSHVCFRALFSLISKMGITASSPRLQAEPGQACVQNTVAE